MARKTVDRYVCRECGYESPRWLGKCPNCEAWNSFGIMKETSASFGTASPEIISAVTVDEALTTPSIQISTGDEELDRVLGGGLTPGAVFLIAGEPGIGKSTLLLRLAGSQAADGTVVYLSGEETAAQIARRAQRLSIQTEGLKIIATQSLDGAESTIQSLAPRLVIVDSVQTIGLTALPNSLGSVSQIREVALELGRLARALMVPVVLVGHVTKEGELAGPKLLEHLVDAVLLLEGDRQHDLRLLRTVKNRFGATDEVGVFTMGDSGLLPVSNPSARFLEGRDPSIPGSAVTAMLEGTRAILVEIQALVQPTQFGYPKRTASGLDVNRLQLLLAVLQERAKVPTGRYDVYVNVVGGVSIKEPAADLAICVAVTSAIHQIAVPATLAVWGEIGLSGEIRNVAAADKRIQETKRVGFATGPQNKDITALLAAILRRSNR